jgi:hypothetical protein
MMPQEEAGRIASAATKGGNGSKPLTALCGQHEVMSLEDIIPLPPLATPQVATSVPATSARKSAQQRFTESPPGLPGLVDIVVDDKGKGVFLVVEQGTLKTLEKVDGHQGIVWVPTPIESLPWTRGKHKLVPPRYSEVKRYFETDSFASLFEDYVTWLGESFAVPDDLYYLLLASFGASTYTPERWDAYPTIRPTGDTDHGKSRLAGALATTSYRSDYLPTAREAQVIRIARLHGLLALDVADLWKAARDENFFDILLNRQSAAGGKVARVLDPKDFESLAAVAHISIEGPTIAISNTWIDNPAYNSRTIPIQMPHSKGAFPQRYAEEGLPFRERFLAMRAKVLAGQILLPDVVVPGVAKQRDIAVPLITMTALTDRKGNRLLDTKYHREVFALLQSLQEGHKAIKSATREGEVVEAVVAAYFAKGCPDHLLHEDWMPFYDEDRSKDERLTHDALGRIAIQKLGLGRFREGEAKRKRGIEVSRETLQGLCAEYGIDFADTSSVQASTGNQIPSDTLDTSPGRTHVSPWKTES